MHKKAQVTVFIILGIMIVFILGLLFALNYSQVESYFKNLQTSNVIIPKQVQGINNFVLDCLKRTTEEAIYFNSKFGGYYAPSLYNIDGIPYFYFNKRNLIIKEIELKNELSNYIIDNIEFCLNDFKDFSKYNVTLGKISTKTTLYEDRLSASVTYPINIKFQDRLYQLSKFEYNVDTNLFTLYNISVSIINYRKSNNNICLSCLNSLAEENDVKINLESYDNNTLVYIIRDEENLIMQVPLEFKFAVEYE